LSSKKPPPTIFWDFDGTLVRGPRWGRICINVLDANHPGHGITHDEIREFLLEGFPWHNPERPHPELSTPAAWWSRVESILARAYREIGYNSIESERLAQLAHELMLIPDGYTPFEETIPALKRLSSRGWRHIILSNNFHELPVLLESLLIRDFIHSCVSSAVIGYEKPHPEVFAIAMEHAGHPEKVWMIGDSVPADIRGAEAAGIPAILVHRPTDEKVEYYADNLLEAVSIIENSVSSL